MSAPYRLLLSEPARAGEPLRAALEMAERASAPRQAYAQWYTEGKGDQDEGDPIAAKLSAQGDPRRCAVELSLPPSPWSYNGEIVKIRWRLVVDGAFLDFDVLPPPRRDRPGYRNQG